CCLLQGIAPHWQYGPLAFGYLFAMHNLNRFNDQRAKIFNDPILPTFYKKYRRLILGLSVFFLLISLGLAFMESRLAFGILAMMSILGILYRVKFIPLFIANRLQVYRLKEIPASKTFFVALAWAMVLVILPAIASAPPGPRTAGVFTFIFLLVLVRNAIFDIFDRQGDRIAGKETLPVLIGLPKTMLVLKFIIALLLVMAVLMPLLGFMAAPLGYFLIPALLYLAVFLVFYEKGYYTPGVGLEFKLESVFVWMAALVWLGYIINLYLNSH
ncbi:MAG: UbiA family prenyltransferase, partial [Deltaproteobacteria bacterium]|nr:UbiA family prenyltransferase [Deltaproteobacteria bacterium]